MTVQHPAFAQTLGAGGDHVLAGNFIEERVLGQDGQGGKAADHQRRYWQYQVPEIVGDFAHGAQFGEVFRDQPAYREPVQRGAAREHHDQEHRKQERRHRVTDDDGRAAPHIKAAAMAHGLAYAQRDRHQVGDQRGPQAEGNRDGHLFQDQVSYRCASEETVAKVQLGIVLEHQPQAFRRGFVEAVLFLDVLDQLRVQAAAGSRAADAFAGCAGYTTATNALQVSDGLFHRPAGRGLHDHEVHQQDDHQRRDDQQQAPYDIGKHQWASPRFFNSACICSFVSGVGLTSHQVSRASSFFASMAGRPKRFHHAAEVPGG